VRATFVRGIKVTADSTVVQGVAGRGRFIRPV
jgi:hypothetical protein